MMNDAEKQLTEFSTAKASTYHEAEDKLRNHKVKRIMGNERPLGVYDDLCLIIAFYAGLSGFGQWFP